MMVASSVEQDTKPRAFSVATELHPQHSLAVVSRVKPKESPMSHHGVPGYGAPPLLPSLLCSPSLPWPLLIGLPGQNSDSLAQIIPLSPASK